MNDEDEILWLVNTFGIFCITDKDLELIFNGR